MAHGIPNEEWTEKIKDVGLKALQNTQGRPLQRSYYERKYI